MPDFLASTGFTPRRYCGDWTAELIWLAYLAIPLSA
jgi:hypothetical protein